MSVVDLPSLADQSIPPFESIPVIDISGLSGDSESKAQVASAIRDACIQIGFFYVKNHGVDNALIASTADAAHRFFDLPMEEKMKIEFRKNPTLKGYYPWDKRGRVHESFELRPGTEISTRESDIWPSEDVLPGFRETVLKY
ncbi:unnamed protein product [Rhizoctonia solani]|uniref:Non-haem dioxygenase N-terminal domain-containing protein n=1 Tax=Rhizoctonia solani TaxID=456999 RepID=A0A8H3AFP7_9AGAM|nr:unnamed protein product [Rhizoctonia solani]